MLWTNADFETMSWHDCHIWGVDLRAGNADDGDWTSIAQIERRPVDKQKVFLDRPYYSFRIASNWPAGGEIVFGAVGFTQTRRSEPAFIDDQRLTLRSRRRTLGGDP